MAGICCPPGYSPYEEGCCADGTIDCGSAALLKPVLCACCPVGYALISSDGSFYNYTTGRIQTIGNPDISTFAGKCCQVGNLGAGHPWATLPSDPVDSIGCPCCPPDYTYDSLSGLCIGRTPTDTVPTTICLDCNCSEVALFTHCSDCTTAGEGISFSWDFTTRQCINCPPVEPIAIPCNLQNFMPIQFADPITTFKLLSLNYM